MSSPSANPALLSDVPAEPAVSWARQVFRRTFSDWRAIAGAVWIVVLAFLAVFAPFLANTHPVLLKMDGKWSSPLLRHLTWSDVTILIMTGVGLFLLRLRGIRSSARFLAFVVVLFLVAFT